jgi:hypothetical protein
MGYKPDTLSYRLRRLLYDHTALGRFVSDRVQFGIRDSATSAEANIVHVTADGLDLYLDRRELPAPGTLADARQIALFREALANMREVAAANGIRLVVFIVPTKEMVYQERFPDAATRTAVDWRYEAVRDLLDEQRIDYVDMLPPLRAAAAQGQQLYFAHDTHWTPLGHDLAARLLVAHVNGACNEGDCLP